MNYTTDASAVNLTPIPLDSTDAWNDFARQTRQINHNNGWGTDFTLESIPGLIALIHSEITEADQTRDTESCVAEFADVVIRAVDLSELIQPGEVGNRIVKLIPWRTHRLKSHTQQDLLLLLHALTSNALERYRKASSDEMCGLVLFELADVASCAFEAAMRRLVPEILSPYRPEAVAQVESVLWAKLAKNATRGHKHGGLRI